VVGKYNSMVLDSNGNPHICYYDSSSNTKNLKYAHKDASGWHQEVLDSAGDVGMYTSAALGPNNCLHISYFDATNYDLKYMYKFLPPPPPPPPSAPTGFIGTAESDLSIRWSWSNVTGEDGYYLHNASHEVKGATAANITNTLEAGLSPNTQYTRHVNAYNSGGSAESGSYSRYTWASAPIGLATIELTSSSVKLSWAGNGTRYAVERATQEAGPWTYIATWENGIATTEYTDTGLASSTIYWYRARGYNAEQVAGSPCSAISATTLAAASSYTTKVGSNEEWVWRSVLTGEAWQWRTWESGSLRKVPQGTAPSWTWENE